MICHWLYGMNPMKYEVENLPNIITTAVMPAEVQNDIMCNQATKVCKLC